MFLESSTEVSRLIDEKIKGLRGKRTQKDIAEKAGIHLSHFSAMKSGVKQINLHHLQSIARGLDVYPSDILPPSWIRPESRTDSSRVEKAIAIVLESYIETIDKHGKDYITPEELAKIAVVLVDDAGSRLDKATLNNTVRIARKIKES